MKTVLVTGSSGFIGYHLCKFLIANEDFVVGIDNHLENYSPELKNTRLDELKKSENFIFYRNDIREINFAINFQENIDSVVHLAAKPGVRSSKENFGQYIESNIHGTTEVLNFCVNRNIKNFYYASSSSVYDDKKSYMSECNQSSGLDSFYGLSKSITEQIANFYEINYQVKTIGFRFFTVYGPYGRPDMAYYKFAKCIYSSNAIELFNNGESSRDMTYIDDVVDVMFKVMKKNISMPNENKIINIGRGEPIKTSQLVILLEEMIQKKAIIQNKLIPEKNKTHASSKLLKELIGETPKVSYKDGLKKFIDWFLVEGKKY